MLKYIVYLLLPSLVFSYQISKNEDVSSSSNLTTKYQGKTAVYWGQASAKQQNPLRYYCDSDSVDIFLVSFLNDFPNSKKSKYGYELNLANECNYHEANDQSKTVPNCTTVGVDIKYCQSLNKTVLLSLGGEQGDYGFNSEREAYDFAKILWNSFASRNDPNFPLSDRPFGNATIDGFDFDLENEDQTGLVTLAKELKKYASQDDSKEYLFTAAPQCTFPDVSMNELIEQVELDHLFVQFYNNECNLNKDFNFDIWSKHIESLNYKHTDIFIGLPANSKSAQMGFANKETILTKMQEVWSDEELKTKFGGVMFWDASQGFGYGDVNTFDTNLITEVASYIDREANNNKKDGDSGVTVSETINTNSSIILKDANDSNSQFIDKVDIAFLIVAFLFSTWLITGS
ncbi:Chitinase 3 [Wickerhamomyces ciferrii]|uniref:chitinase n=1 Tax=Wickerhamomyces ciferrii (strain ATCC 14091 / BCRC 22168 / CBS 111 / JCM 3599 / NBRC 0793 / NRRL Y-1031 F-60-10) TaxID=1206466 RepID=K0KQA6_WICCF|nr:Chitinase 3 [Wickerhamomyces ciferrii]CCH43403.1 Chitinase 3 [Wickerhamomyces ciferrii]